MKPLLALLICCFAFSIVHAQVPLPRVMEIRPGTSFQFKDGKYFIKPLNDSSIVINGLSLPQNKKPGVYRLRLDNMPCIVPDTKDVAAMPNAFKEEIKVPFSGNPPRIPNAAPLQSFQYRVK